MSKDTMQAAPDREPQAKPRVSKQKVSKQRVSKPEAAKPKTGKPKSKASAKAAPSKAAVTKAAKAIAKTTNKTTNKPSNKAATKPKPAKSAGRKQAVVSAPALSFLGQSLQATVPAAVAVNTKLVAMAQANVSAGLELARDLAGAKTPMEAMQLGVAYWFNHMGAVQAQARELQSLSAAWVKTASAQVRAG